MTIVLLYYGTTLQQYDNTTVLVHHCPSVRQYKSSTIRQCDSTTILQPARDGPTLHQYDSTTPARDGPTQQQYDSTTIRQYFCIAVRQFTSVVRTTVRQYDKMTILQPARDESWRPSQGRFGATNQARGAPGDPSCVKIRKISAIIEAIWRQKAR